MILTPHNIVYYLLDRGLVTPESVVDGDFLVVEHSSRNRNFKVFRHVSPSYFVKQVKTGEPDALASLQTEATCYWLAQNDADFAPLADLVPQFYGYDPARHVLVMELLPTSENLSEYHRRLGNFPPEMGLLVGKQLGAYQREVGVKLQDSGQKTKFRQQVPWILSVHQLPWHLAPGQSGANAQLLSIVQRYPEFQSRLDTLRSEWKADSLIHGDIKWDNCVVTGQHDPEALPTLKIVDWELADVGDACWDVGAIFQAYLSFWIFSMPVSGDMLPTQFVALAQYPLEAMQPAIHAFWHSYTETRGIEEQDRRALLERSVQHAAARMIQTAYEYMYFAPQISPQVVALLQVSLNILESPGDAIAHLLGM
jgi:hypothetical protein